MKRRTRSRRGGGIMDSFSQWTSSFSTGASDLWNKTKQSTASSYGSLMGSTPTASTTTTSTYVPPAATYTQGGKRRRTHKRRMRGGNGYFMAAAPVTGIKTAQPQAWVGGRRTRRARRSHRRRR